MKISKRLLCVIKMIDKDDNIVDVGADHGLIEKYLLENNHQGKILAVENKIGPLTRLQKTLRGRKAEVILSDGLTNVKDEFDTAIFAGFGGLLITQILDRDLKNHQKINKIIIDAHHDIETLRRYLVSNGFMIDKEDLVYEKNHYYFIIRFLKGFKAYNDDELTFGYKIKMCSEFFNYQKDKINKLTNLINDPNISEEIKNEFKIKRKRLENL